MSNRERILDFLKSIAPTDASNSEILSRTMIRPHQQVFQITQALMREGRIAGRLFGKEWRFRAVATSMKLAQPKAMRLPTAQEAKAESVKLDPSVTKQATPPLGELSQREVAYFGKVAKKDEALRSILLFSALPQEPNASEWFNYWNDIRVKLGNISNDLGFFATLLAKSYLAKRFAVTFDAAEKAQGAPGADIDVTTLEGKRIVCELKTTKPYQKGFGAAQKKEMLKDLLKLQECGADHKIHDGH